MLEGATAAYAPIALASLASQPPHIPDVTGASVAVASLARNVNHAVDGAQHEVHQPWMG